MLSKGQMIELFYEIDERLRAQEISGEILMAGGASLALVYNTRDATKDIDAIFAPAKEIREIIDAIADEKNLDNDWLNDGVKGFIDTNKQETEVFLKLSNLTVKTIDAEGLLAMKLSSARYDGKDLDDALRLMEHLNVRDIDKLYDLVEERIPANQRTAKAGFFIQLVWNRYTCQDHSLADKNLFAAPSISPKDDIEQGKKAARARSVDELASRAKKQADDYNRKLGEDGACHKRRNR